MSAPADAAKAPGRTQPRREASCMDIVVVGGPHSGVGKTLASEIALRALRARAMGAIKLTVADGERNLTHDHGASALTVADAAGICGRGMSCGVCETVSTRMPSRLIMAQGAIRKSGTDTCRLHDAGAVAVAWVIALREAAPGAIENAMEQLAERGADMILIEGTTALEWLRPRASVMVTTDPGRSWKEVALCRLASCDIVLRNRGLRPPGDVPAPALLAAANPVDCDLSDPHDAGTLEYERRLRDLCGLSERPASAARAATAGR